MSRCRRTDAIADVVADPALGVDALTEEQWAHVGICADCHATVRGLEELDRALTAGLRAMPHEDLPPTILATPAVARRPAGPPLGTMLAVAAVVVLAVGVATFGAQWLGARGLGIGTEPSRPPATDVVPSPAASSSAESSAAPSTEPTPAPTAAATPVPSPEPEPIALAIGQVAAVVDEPLVVRTAPGTDPDSTIMPDRLWIGQRVRILDGPADVDGYTWWEVEVGEVRGWVADAEADDSAPWLAPLTNGRIWFWRYPGETGAGGMPELSSVRADGSDERSIGDPTAVDQRLVVSCGPIVGTLEWRHDGAWAAFDASPGGCDRTVYAVSADGGELRRLADGWAPAWRPDGAVLAVAPNAPYLAVADVGDGELREVTLDGVARQLTDSGTRLNTGWPAWSPDRRQIAYMGSVPADGDGAVWTTEVYVAAADGGDPRVIGEGMRPVWSPDGRWIVVERAADDAVSVELWRMRPDGSDATSIGEGSMARFSPDGTRLAVLGPNGVFTMAPDGSDVAGVISATSVDGFAWAPDGSSLVVASNHASDASVGISIVRLDGAAPAIIPIVAQGHAPSWQPVVVDPRLPD